ncbi:MAG: leucine-rich repeat domain-containing protein [Clostridiales bacterium]|nr:leucine-rich repeat domain-containing protein [Clostridiales bacterium]
MKSEEKQFQFGKDIFQYVVVNNAYICITGYATPFGPIVFSQDPDLRFRYHIYIPEAIDDLPVCRMDRIKVSLREDYKHDGYNGMYDSGSGRYITIHAPEGMSFQGFWNYNNYDIVYYSRNCYDIHYGRPIMQAYNNLLVHDTDTAYYIAKKTSDSTCELIHIGISGSHNRKILETGKLEIPGSFMAKPNELYALTKIGEDSFLDSSESLSTLVLPDSLQTIGSGCFNKLPNLKEVYLGKELTSIEDNCFSYYQADRDYQLREIPGLTVHYYQMPKYSESTFHRHATAYKGDEYADWGWVQSGEREITYPVQFVCRD